MQVDALAVDLRPRSMMEAGDLGVRLVQWRALDVWRCYLPVFLAVLALALATAEIASCSERATWQPSISPRDLETTMFLRPGSGCPIDSKVFLPIKTACPMVMDLKRARSVGLPQGSFPSRPITLSSDIAAIREMIIEPPSQFVLAKFQYNRFSAT
jgi:hypothetical protein